MRCEVTPMSDINDELRELFQRRADDVPPHRMVPRSLVSRARRRIALNMVGAGVVVLVLAGGAFAEVRVLGGLPARQRVVTPGPSLPRPTPPRSEERRVGKECRSRWSPAQ